MLLKENDHRHFRAQAFEGPRILNLVPADALFISPVKQKKILDNTMDPENTLSIKYMHNSINWLTDMADDNEFKLRRQWFTAISNINLS